MKVNKEGENYVKYVINLTKMNASFTHRVHNRNEKITRRRQIMVNKVRKDE